MKHETNVLLTSLFIDGGLENLFARRHYAEVDDAEVVAAEDNAHNVLSDIVHIALDRRKHYRTLIRTLKSTVLGSSPFIGVFILGWLGVLTLLNPDESGRSFVNRSSAKGGKNLHTYHNPNFGRELKKRVMAC